MYVFLVQVRSVCALLFWSVIIGVCVFVCLSEATELYRPVISIRDQETNPKLTPPAYDLTVAIVKLGKHSSRQTPNTSECFPLFILYLSMPCLPLCLCVLSLSSYALKAWLILYMTSYRYRSYICTQSYTQKYVINYNFC